MPLISLPDTTVAVRFSGAAIAVAGSPSDLLTAVVGVPRYVILQIIAECISAAGTLAAATVDIRTATGGGGSSILDAATMLDSLTAANLTQPIAPAALGSVLTAQSLTLRQTVDSGNAGVVSVVVLILPLP